MMRKTKEENNGETSSEPGEIETSKKNSDKIDVQDGETVNQKANKNADPKTEETIDSCEVKDKQIADLSDKFIRLAAEYDNFRRRSQKEKDALLTETIADVAKVWLPVVDNLERAVLISADYKHEEARKIADGVNMVLQQVKEAMNTLGITEIDALNNPFDPNAMEAIMHVEDKDAGESQVVEVFEKGYKRGDKIIRHSIVKVAN
ncbi:MAG: nucleotide exchange factor GrpE [Saccharofermentanales bacterium]